MKNKVKLPKAVLDQFREFGSKGGKKQKRKYSKKQLSAWGAMGTAAREAKKERKS